MIPVVKIVNTHGIGGEVKGMHETDGDAFFDVVHVLYDQDETPYEIERYRFQKGMVLLKLRGIDTVEDAERCRGLELFARREDLPKLPDGRYYIVDMLGLVVVLPDGSTLGVVEDVFPTGGSDTLQIKRESGKTVYIPNVPAFTRIVMEEKTVYVTPIEGMIDDEI